VLVIGEEPDRTRPTAWIDGNMHAGELAGSAVVLAIAEDLINLHLHPGSTCHGLCTEICDHLRSLRFFLMPRISPDGAEVIVTGATQVRSVPRDDRPGSRRPRWRVEDINGDGRCLVMRQPDPTGEFSLSTMVPGLLVPRQLGDSGPFYKVYPEGRIEGFDGHAIPTPGGVDDGGVDLNRNFPWSWAPEPTQAGAGSFPTSEPETRAVVEYTSKHPSIFAWINYHTFGGVFIRPLGHALDDKMTHHDLCMFKQVEAWATEATGYPTVCGYKEFTYAPGKPLLGDVVDYAYHQRGCLTFAVELWDVFERAGIGPRERFVERYATLNRNELEAIALWDRTANGGRCVQPWVAFDHPQIGAVEVGGIDPRFGLWNPPESELAQVCRQHAQVALQVAAMAPRVVLQNPRVEDLGNGLAACSLDVENHGYLPTHGLDSAQKLTWNEGLVADADITTSLSVEAPDSSRIEVGHLDGWGRGPFGEQACLYFQRSRGTTGRKHLRWVVSGHGELVVRVSGPRVGEVTHRFTVSAT